METKSIGEKLIALRGNRSQAEVATGIGVTTAAVGMYERNERIPKDQIKMRIADYFGVSVQEIFFAE